MLARLREITRHIAREVRVCALVMRDPRTPRLARVILGCGVAYALSPIDLIPDFLPVIGHLDDAVIVPLLIAIGLALVPREVVRDHREACVRGESER